MDCRPCLKQVHNTKQMVRTIHALRGRPIGRSRYILLWISTLALSALGKPAQGKLWDGSRKSHHARGESVRLSLERLVAHQQMWDTRVQKVRGDEPPALSLINQFVDFCAPHEEPIPSSSHLCRKSSAQE
jgi:hypothetical protein